jgi:excisionase family DNA binding protein
LTTYNKTRTEVEEVFNRSEAAQFLKISKPTLDKLVARKEIPYMILGDQKRFIKSDLLNLGKN